MNHPNILAVITARGGSKGLPGKNIKMLGGKPLIVYSIEVGKKSKLITDLIVSTDSKEIADVARTYGGEIPFMRPEELARDDTPHVPVMQHAVNFMEVHKGVIYDLVVTFQPTSPFRNVDHIDKTIEKLVEHPEADSAVSIYEINPSQHPMKIKKLEGDRVVPFCVEEPDQIRRQDIPPVYKRSSAVYVTRRDVLMKQGKTYGDVVVGHVVPGERSVDIDNDYDWYKAEGMLKDLQSKGFSF